MPPFLGCLGPGWVVETSNRIACYGAIVAGVIGVVCLFLEWRRGRVVWWPIYGALVLLHPGWRMWPSFGSGVLVVSSDCGYSDRFVSVAIVAVLVGVLLLLVFRPDFSRQLFLVVLAAICWQLYLATWLIWHP